MSTNTLLVLLPPLLALASAWAIGRQIRSSAKDIDKRQARLRTRERAEGYQPTFISTPKHLEQ